jgi:hypothetical protein
MKTTFLQTKLTLKVMGLGRLMLTQMMKDGISQKPNKNNLVASDPHYIITLQPS